MLKGKQGNADELVSPIPFLSCTSNYEALYAAVWNCHALISVHALSTIISNSSWLSLLIFLLCAVMEGKSDSATAC